MGQEAIIGDQIVSSCGLVQGRTQCLLSVSLNAAGVVKKRDLHLLLLKHRYTVYGLASETKPGTAELHTSGFVAYAGCSGLA